jgi:hypothetical protein
MDSARKKALRDAYKNRKVVGGVCCIRCSDSQRVWIQATNDVESLKNRFEFAIATKSAPDPSMRGEWMKYGTDSFSFTVLEEIKKREDETDAEFADDLQVLHDIWMEKYQQGDL